jgi:four helix bundle protein
MFRFENLEIWKESIQIAGLLFEIGDEMHDMKLWRFADQIRGVGMSISNNICESTGSGFLNEQRQFLRYAKRECYEAANIIILLEMKNILSTKRKAELYNRLDTLSKRIQAYSNSLQ